MPGGVAGAQSTMTAPYADLGQQKTGDPGGVWWRRSISACDVILERWDVRLRGQGAETIQLSEFKV